MSLTGFKEVNSLDRFASGIIRKVGFGSQTSLWKDPWLETTPLRIKFLGLFSNFFQPDDGLVRRLNMVVNKVVS